MLTSLRNSPRLMEKRTAAGLHAMVQRAAPQVSMVGNCLRAHLRI